MITKNSTKCSTLLKNSVSSEQKINADLRSIIPKELLATELTKRMLDLKGKTNLSRDLILEKNSKKIWSLYSQNKTHDIITLDTETSSTKYISNKIQYLEASKYMRLPKSSFEEARFAKSQGEIRAIGQNDQFVNINALLNPRRKLNDETFVYDVKIRRGKRHQAFVTKKGKKTFTVIHENEGEVEYEFYPRKIEDYIFSVPENVRIMKKIDEAEFEDVDSK